jgi:hypothetical protein
VIRKFARYSLPHGHVLRGRVRIVGLVGRIHAELRPQLFQIIGVLVRVGVLGHVLVGTHIGRVPPIASLESWHRYEQTRVGVRHLIRALHTRASLTNTAKPLGNATDLITRSRIAGWLGDVVDVG